MPEISLGKTMGKPIFRELPVHPGGETYTVFDEESDFQVENEQFRRQRSEIWKNLIKKILVFNILVFKHSLYYLDSSRQSIYRVGRSCIQCPAGGPQGQYGQMPPGGNMMGGGNGGLAPVGSRPGTWHLVLLAQGPGNRLCSLPSVNGVTL